MKTRKAEPSTVGEILKEEFLVPLSLSEEELASKMELTLEEINDIVGNRRALSSVEAIRLAEMFGVDRHFWINIQTAHNHWKACS